MKKKLIKILVFSLYTACITWVSTMSGTHSSMDKKINKNTAYQAQLTNSIESPSIKKSLVQNQNEYLGNILDI